MGRHGSRAGEGGPDLEGAGVSAGALSRGLRGAGYAGADDPRFVHNAAQLCKAAGSVAANIAEGYPRLSGKDRAKFYEFGLTSLAEVKSWYLGVRSFIDGRTVDDRLATMRSIHRLVLTMMRSARANGAKELDQNKEIDRRKEADRVRSRRTAP